mmetsp:Transcript_51068/g.142897  ORF Transcript_51068/g.142897 Transcript_51068/m.142897 type:complete len:97 (+) Transcript_51068:575-865(+)
MDSISVKSYVVDNKFQATDFLFTHWAFITCPLKTTYHGVFNFIQICNTDSLFNDNIGTNAIITETPDLLGSCSFFPTKCRVFSKKLCSIFSIHTRT